MTSLMIVISIASGYLLFNIKNETELDSFKPVSETTEKQDIDKQENKKPSPPVKEYKFSLDPETVPNIPDLQDKPEPLKTLLNPNKDDTDRNEAANFLRDSGYKGLTDDLITVLNNQNEKARFRSFCIQHLYNNYKNASGAEKNKTKNIFYNGLKDMHIKVQRESLLSLVRIGDPKGKETTVKWLLGKDTDKVRDLAFRCSYMLNLKEYIPEIRKYTGDSNEVIRIAAIVALSQWGDKESRIAFEKAANSKSVRVQRAGQAALKRLSEKEDKQNNKIFN